MIFVRRLIGDLPASFVVFLVALPLCMGIAIASGVPPALGLVTGIVGGIVTGLFAGAPLQVSGPAAGLTVLVFQAVNQFGLSALGPIVFICGAIQMLAGSAKLGQWFRAVNPAVIYGMLSGIGVLIISSQIHIAFDSKPGGSPLDNLALLPAVFEKLVSSSTTATAGMVSILTLMAMFLWDKMRPTSLKSVPAPLMAVLLATFVCYLGSLPIDYVKLPSSFAAALNIPSAADWRQLATSGLLTTAVGLAIIASAETLLCASALKRMRSDAEVGYNKELFAQGIGNTVCGLLGALPMTGVIVRSSANAAAGARTRWSAVLHGVWLLLFVVMLPELLSFIPMAALAAILIYTGLKLVNPSIVQKLRVYGKPAVVLYFSTVAGIVFTDLLTGVLIGVGMSFLRLLGVFSHIKIKTVVDEAGVHNMTLKGAATFLTLPKIAQALEAIPLEDQVALEFDRMFYVDHACMDLFDSQKEQRASAGGQLVLDSSQLKFAWKVSETGGVKHPRESQAPVRLDIADAEFRHQAAS